MITLLKIITIPCMILLIAFLLMAMGYIPSEKAISFLKDKQKTQIFMGIAMMIGLLGSFIAVTT